MNSLKLKVQGLAGIMRESKIPGHIYLKSVIKNEADNRSCSHGMPVLITINIKPN